MEPFSDTHFILPSHDEHLNMEHYWGSVNCGEGDLDSDINRLASGDLRQYTTAPSQCEKLPRIWTWNLLYFDRWYNFEKRPGSVWSVTCKQLPLQQWAYLLRIAILQLTSIRWVINIVLIYIIARYTCVGIFTDIVHWPTKCILFLLCFILKCHRYLLFSQISNLFICSIFETQPFFGRQRNP